MVRVCTPVTESFRMAFASGPGTGVQPGHVPVDRS